MATVKPHPPQQRGGGREQRRLCLMDRRSGLDLRRVYSLDYFAAGGVERRYGRDRRSGEERRAYWELEGLPCVGRSP